MPNRGPPFSVTLLLGKDGEILDASGPAQRWLDAGGGPLVGTQLREIVADDSGHVQHLMRRAAHTSPEQYILSSLLLRVAPGAIRRCIVRICAVDGQASETTGRSPGEHTHYRLQIRAPRNQVPGGG